MRGITASGKSVSCSCQLLVDYIITVQQKLQSGNKCNPAKIKKVKNAVPLNSRWNIRCWTAILYIPHQLLPSINSITA